MADGRQSMCDSCPDIIPYKGRLVWSCRVDELEKFGSFVAFGPKEQTPVDAPMGAQAEAIAATPSQETASGPNDKKQTRKAPVA